MILIALAAFVATTAHACPQYAAGGMIPQAPAANVVICEDGYVLGHDKTRRDPLWSAEVETPSGAKAALAAKRLGAFHEDALIPSADQASQADYRCSNYDKGHMTPVGDFGDPAEEAATFSMANMVPQDFRLNEGLWAGIEGALLHLAASGDTLYVVTGPEFAANAPLLNKRVAIPSATWKAVYDATKGLAVVYVANNDGSGHYRIESVTALAAEIGFDPMPGVPDKIKALPMAVAKPLKGTTPRPDRSCAKH